MARDDRFDPRRGAPGVSLSDRQLDRRLAAILFDPRLDPARLVPRLRELRVLEKHDACSAAVELLAHLELPEIEAEILLLSLSEHRSDLARLLGRDPGIAVAAADYLGQVTGRLPDPVILERSHRGPSERTAATDPLTGLPDRRSFMRRLELEIRRARRFASQLAIVTLDLDSFKPVNDVYGRPLGDRVLHGAGELLHDAARETDTVARTGGDGFSMILPAAERLSAFLAAERIRQRLASRFLSRPVDARVVAMTVSAGVACFPGDGDAGEPLLAAALAALKRAKVRGGDGTVMHPEEKRRTVRWPSSAKAAGALAPRTGGAGRPARTVDVSERGALVETTADCEVSQAVTLVLGSRGGDRAVPAWVVRVEREPRRLGLAFERPLAPQVLAELAGRERSRGVS